MKTYHLVQRGNDVGIRCLQCWNVSWNLNDVLRRYCGYCHLAHEEDIPPAPKVPTPVQGAL